MRICVTIWFVLLALGLPINVEAQEATEEPSGVPVIGQSWLRVDLDAEPSEETEAHYVVFLSLDDGATLIEVAGGADVVYTRGDDGLYSGVPLIPTAAYEFEASLETIDEETRQVTSVTRAGVVTIESNLRFERTDLEYGVWVEGERDLIEFSMFVECLGRVGVEPPRAWVNPDPIVPIRLDDEAGTLTIGDTVLAGGGDTYERIDEDEFGQFAQVITQRATVSDELITFSYHAIADGRDDCEVRYETTFVPFDEDYEALFSRAVELGEDE